MSTYRALLWSLLASAYIATVGALPDNSVISLENLLSLYIGQQNLVTLLMFLLNSSHSLKELSNLVKTFLPGSLGKLRIQPRVVLRQGRL